MSAVRDTHDALPVAHDDETGHTVVVDSENSDAWLRSDTVVDLSEWR